MKRRLIFIKYATCLLVFASAATMVQSFPPAPEAELGGAAAIDVKGEPLTPSAYTTQVAIGSL